MGNLKEILDKMTPEQKAELKEKRRLGSINAAKRRRDEKERILREAKNLLPQLVAEDILLADHKNYTPSPETLRKLKEYLGNGKQTVEEVRNRFFPNISDDGWAKLIKFVFKSQISSVETLGVDLVRAKQKEILALRKNIALLKRAQKEWKKSDKSKGKVINLGILDRIMASEKRLFELEVDFAETLHSVGAVGEKNKSAALHIHMNTPRPKEKVIEAKVIDSGHRD